MTRLWILGVMLSGAAWARDCPFERDDDLFREKVAMAIRAEKTCVAAANLAQSCAVGRNGDTIIALAAERKCGLDFWSKLTPEDKKFYNILQAKCDAKFPNPSLDSFCKLSVAQLYSKLYSKVSE